MQHHARKDCMITQMLQRSSPRTCRVAAADEGFASLPGVSISSHSLLLPSSKLVIFGTAVLDVTDGLTLVTLSLRRSAIEEVQNRREWGERWGDFEEGKSCLVLVGWR